MAEITKLEGMRSKQKTAAEQFKKIIAEQKEELIALAQMTPADQREQDLVWGIKTGNLNEVVTAIKQGASVKDAIKSVYGSVGGKRFVGRLLLLLHTHLKSILLLRIYYKMEHKIQSYLLVFVEDNALIKTDPNKVDWLLKNGAKDINNQIYDELVDDVVTEKDSSKKAKDGTNNSVVRKRSNITR